ncbi:MAG: hypothetical protein ABR964_13740 [Tepidisphaeraceae bacterium]
MIPPDPVSYRPFLDPLPIWVRPWLWVVLLVPLCAVVAVVYKSIRCRDMSRVPREAATLLVTILVCMVLAAAVLAGIAKLMQ